jgi:hypothetical protein
VFFHLYVPNGRYQEAQLASFLRLFESYLQRIEKLQFSIETRRTLYGQVYEFKSKNDISDLTEMEDAIFRFKDFMSLCQNDHKKAEAVMIELGLSSANAAQLLTKYTKDYQRLIFDTQQEFEQKIFALQQEFERRTFTLQQRLKNEAFELAAGNVLPLTQTIQPNAFLSLANNSGSININIF